MWSVHGMPQYAYEGQRKALELVFTFYLYQFWVLTSQVVRHPEQAPFLLSLLALPALTPPLPPHGLHPYSLTFLLSFPTCSFFADMCGYILNCPEGAGE